MAKRQLRAESLVTADFLLPCGASGQAQYMMIDGEVDEAPPRAANQSWLMNLLRKR